MGSGETAPPMAKVHRRLTAMIERRPPSATLIATPYAFQENADEITARTLDYFATNVGAVDDRRRPRRAPMRTRSRRPARWRASRKPTSCSPDRGVRRYALAQWRPAGLASVLATHLQRSGIVTFASAAALTLGSHAIPVYEIYKVGADPVLARWARRPRSPGPARRRRPPLRQRRGRHPRHPLLLPRRAPARR